jgi:hypothetical protein
MKKEDIKELYSISSKDGTLLLVKRDIDSWTKGKAEYSYHPDVLVNPEIKIMDNGVLSIKGERLDYQKVRTIRDRWHWAPTPVIGGLNRNWKERIFFSEEDDIIRKDVVAWTGKWPFKKRHKEKDVEHLNHGYYLSKEGYTDVQTTSNYRLIGYEEQEIRGIL